MEKFIIRWAVGIVVACCVSVHAGCATVQESKATTRSSYKKVWNACIESVSDVRFSVSSTDPTSGLIIADSAVVSGQGTVSRLNIQLLKALSDTTVAVKFVPPWGTIGGWGTANRYMEALKKRIPDLRVAGEKTTDEREIDHDAGELKKTQSGPINSEQTSVKSLPPPVSPEKTSVIDAPQKRIQRTIAAKGGRLRKTPYTSGKILKNLKKDQVVEIVEQKGDWCLVDVGGGEVGWCHVSVLRAQ